MSKIIVVGDVTKDWFKWNNEVGKNADKEQSNYDVYQGSRINYIYGGAIVLKKMTEQLINQTKGKTKVLTYENIENYEKKFIHTMCDLEKYQYSIEEENHTKKVKNRVENFLVFPPDNMDEEAPDLVYENINYEKDDIILIHDADNYFRRSQRVWPNIILNNDEKTEQPIFIHKMHLPYESGKLWNNIIKKNRIIVIIDVIDLRKNGLRISEGLSWERTAYDLRTGIEAIIDDKIENNELNTLKEFLQNKQNNEWYLIVRFGLGGAILYHKNNISCEYTLFFDPQVFEGSIEHKYPGEMIGLGNAFVSGLTFGIQNFSESGYNLNKAIIDGIKKGIIVSRKLHKNGFINEKNKMNYPFKDMFPTSKETKVIQKIEIENDISWTILEQKLDDKDQIYCAAIQFVKHKRITALKSPVARFGKLITADRDEIEGYHSIKNLIIDYLGKTTNIPLSIAVFGPPGSGKSFGVTNLAKTISDDIKKVEFNLSQFQSPKDLFSAFHIVQSTSLRGKIPLVFFDEFDCNLNGIDYGWLRYFLGPMNDGEFKQGDIIHPIGKSIFVFAGGTSENIANFNPGKNVKGSDFKSRLRGFVNIVGINNPNINRKYCRSYCSNCLEIMDCEDSKENYLYMIRRATTLRNMLEETSQNIFYKDENNEKKAAIDPSVLNALIKIPEFKHGVRSMKAIIEMSSLSGKTTYNRSSLPSSEQLELHVDKKEFKTYLNEKVTKCPKKTLILGKTSVILDIDDINLNLETALICNILISELVSNSLKHAFPNNKKGKITVSLKAQNEWNELVISDNGVGFPEGIEFKNPETLSLKMLNVLVEKLDEGEITLDRRNGTSFTIKFK